MCIPCEKGCLVFGILSAIFYSLLLLACLTIGVLSMIGVTVIAFLIDNTVGVEYSLINHNEELREAIMAWGGLVVCIVILIISMPFLNGFVFSVLLCDGICQRRPGQVKAYFIYGVVTIIMAVISCIVGIVYIPNNAVLYGLSGLAGCAIYSLILWMVFATYVKLSANTVYSYDKIHCREVGI